MNFLSNIKIGQRLALGFAIVLGLSILTTVIGILKLDAVAEAAAKMLDEPVRKDRLISDWSSNIAMAVQRTTAIIKSSDSSLTQVFAANAEETDKKAAFYLKEVEPLLTSADEKQAFAAMMEVRKDYKGGRQKAIALKEAGQLQESNEVHDKVYIPAAQAYQAGMARLVKIQRDRVDELDDQIRTIKRESRRTVLLLAFLSTAFSIVCAWWLGRSIVKPVREAVDVAQRVAAGDLTADPQVGSRDEIGQLQAALKHMNDQLLGMVGEIRGGSDAIATASSQIAAGNHDLSSRTEQQAGALEETASSMEELNSTVTQTADNARQASQLAAAASMVANRGGAVVAQVVETMASIDASSKKIADIISVIDGIAFQTNILALNAAVEAARAGEQGRGFAVVASEVRNLAQRSASAAKEIKGLISDSVAKVGDGAKLVDEAGSTMEEIVTSVKRVTDIMAEISLASQEQSAGIEQVNQAIGQMDETTQQNATLVEQAGAAASALQEEAENLARLVSIFKLSGADSGARQPSAAASVAARQAGAGGRARIAGPASRAAKPKTKADPEFEVY
jgi:methyl-accepting chemotaxis protein